MQLHEKWNIFHWTVVYLVNWNYVFWSVLFFYFSNENIWTTNHLYSIVVYHVVSRFELLFYIEMNFVLSNCFEIPVHWVYFLILKHSLTNTHKSLPGNLYIYIYYKTVILIWRVNKQQRSWNSLKYIILLSIKITKLWFFLCNDWLQRVNLKVLWNK